MAVELNFRRADPATPWGFRLTGGADVDVPLTVIKVTEGSIAEDAGMKVGDLLVRVGDNATAGLTHLQAHDLLKEAGNTFTAAVIRGELPDYFTESEQTFDSETSHDGMSQSLQINIKTNVVDTTKIIVESDEYVEQNIKINGEIVTDQKDVNLTVNSAETISEQIQTVETESKDVEMSITETNAGIGVEQFMPTVECVKESEVLKVLKEEAIEAKEVKMGKEKRWTTFLQKPERPKPKLKPKEDEEPKNTTDSSSDRDEHFMFTRLLSVLQEPPYRVIIKKHKRKTEAEKAAEMNSQESTPIPDELSMTPDFSTTSEQELQALEEQQEEEEDRIEEQPQVEFEEPEEQMVSEVEMSLEEQLGAIQRQLLALSQLPAAIQQTLDVVTQQLTKIVGPVDEPNREENELEETQEDTLEERDTEDRTGELETVEEVSESGYDRDSQQGDSEGQELRVESAQDQEDESEHREMLQVSPEPEEDLTPEEREARRIEQEKEDKKHKILHWNNIWPWGDRLGRKIYRDSNTHLVPSKVSETKKINFLKYEPPPPPSLEHLKHSEVYRLVHDMEPPPRGVASRHGKAMAEEDYYVQTRKSSQDGQSKG